MPFFEIFTLAFSFFLLMDPIGNVPLYISILNNVQAKKRKKIILREMLISLLIILIFAFVGEGALNLLKISSATLSISGGILLFLIALKMIFTSDFLEAPKSGGLSKEPFIVPLAVPLVAGPSILASVMIYAKRENSQLVLISAIFIAWVISFIILILSDELKRVLKENTIVALERLMGLILSLIAVQMFLEGMEAFLMNIAKVS